MDLALIGQAIAAFAATNVDDLVVLSVFFGLAVGRPDADRAHAIGRVWMGQYLGFLGILVASVLGALGAGLLPHGAVACLGLIPIALGLRLIVVAWWRRARRVRNGDAEADAVVAEERMIRRRTGPGGPTIVSVALVTFAGGGDNFSLYVPLFTSVGIGGSAVCIAVFLPLVAVWCAATMFLSTRPPITRAIVRWGGVVLPLVLIGIGVHILVSEGAFGL